MNCPFFGVDIANKSLVASWFSCGSKNQSFIPIQPIWGEKIDEAFEPGAKVGLDWASNRLAKAQNRPCCRGEWPMIRKLHLLNYCCAPAAATELSFLARRSVALTPTFLPSETRSLRSECGTQLNQDVLILWMDQFLGTLLKWLQFASLKKIARHRGSTLTASRL